MTSKSRRAFTLVELLVVIGIISVLVAVLLPALGAPRAQANLVACQSNLRQMGQLVNMYAVENRGYVTYGFATAYEKKALSGAITWVNFTYGPPGPAPWTWTDTLTLMINKNRNSTPGYLNNAAKFLGIFQDTDTTQFNVNNPRVCNYIVNPRAFMCTAPTIFGAPVDPQFEYRLRKLASIKRQAAVMIIWDGAQQVSTDATWGGTSYPAALSLDNWQWGWGHGLCYPTPALSYFPIADYNKPLGLGSGAVNTVTDQKIHNIDGDDFFCNMRFRHLKSSATNALFADGHVEMRKIGEVLVKDVCMNP